MKFLIFFNLLNNLFALKHIKKKKKIGFTILYKFTNFPMQMSQPAVAQQREWILETEKLADNGNYSQFITFLMFCE